MPQVNEYSWLLMSLNLFFAVYIFSVVLSFTHMLEVSSNNSNKMFFYNFGLMI